ncbi:hypothetical protein POM88_037779 [Heracleum sosnowskyi]|uniref:HECT-type E3 ubiquitin transferase n=1 Tax=Heracleum sosnowskyi TaxID=360622 RepID=A0AAD8MG56_9APIA|nr:hypothetical protein POM88_037779 [Heracleum sosnowskyi]
MVNLIDPNSERADGIVVTVDWFYTMSKELLDHHDFFKVRNDQFPRAFYISDLESLLCGTTDLAVDEWERCVVYGGSYTARHEAINMFWEIVNMCAIDLDLPYQETIDLLPLARTCVLQLRLPRYSSSEIMRTCLHTVANSDLVRDSFGFA